MAGDSFLVELRKRKVLQSAAIYGAVAWGVTEVIVTVVEQLFLPQWVSTLSVIGFVVGFPVAMFLAWTFDITSEGIRRTEISSRRGAASIVGSIVLLIAGTASLFLLIRPAMQQADQGTSTAVLAPNSVAVLPFENVSRRESDYYLSGGLGDELRDQLGRVRGLQIAARSSSVAIRNQAVGAIQMAGTLGVSYLVEGSLRRNGPRLSISVQLIDGSTGLSVWSDNYERSGAELLDVQQDIARQVVSIVLPDAPDTRLAAPATLNPNANDLLLLARHYDNQVRSRQEVDTEKLLEAIRLYREATVADPQSALAHSRLASALLYIGDIEAAETSILTALSINPELSEVQNTLGEFYWAVGKPEAGDAFAKAVELNDNNVDALHNYANLRWMTTLSEADGAEAERLYRRALKLDRMSLSRHAALGTFLGKNGQPDDIPPVIQEIRDLFESVDSHRTIAWLYELRGEVDRAIAWTLRARQLEPDNLDHVNYLADLYAHIGDAETALRLTPSPSISLLYHLRRYEELIDIAELRMIEEPDDMDVRHLLAFAYSATGAFEQAIHVLGSTGLPDSALNNNVRSELEWDGFHTLIDTLAASEIPEAVEAGQSLAQWNEEGYWFGDIATIAVIRGCMRVILGMHDEALEVLSRAKEGLRLPPLTYLYDYHCYQQYKDNPVYQDVVRDQEMRRAALRERLPATLAEFGLSPP